jgi:hypothetical protein
VSRRLHEREPEPRISSSGVAGGLDPAPALTCRCDGCDRPLGLVHGLRNGKPWCGQCSGEGNAELGIDITERR